MRRLAAILGSVIVISFGMWALFGLTTDHPLFVDSTNVFLQLVSITVAVTVLIGIVNLLIVHLGRIRTRGIGWGYSVALLIALLAVIVVTVLERLNVLAGEPSLTSVLVEQVQVAVESSLAGLLLFALVYGAYRALRKRVSGWGLLFIAALLVMLIGVLPVPGLSPVITLREWLMAVPVSAGARGILLGIALATVVTGIRVLIGQDRSYRE